MPSPAEQLAAWRDFPRVVAAHWTVYPKEGKQAVPFVLTASQRAVDGEIQRELQESGRVRLAVLKYRQARCSTYCCARMQHGVQTVPGITALSIADKLDLPAQWIRRARGWLNQTPEAWRPKAANTNAIELYFADWGSRYMIGSAEGKTPGVGLTIQRFHGSEPAYWLHPDDIERQTFQAIPLVKDSWVILEGTGESAGDWWSSFWWRAKNGESDYRAVFLSWLMDEGYHLPVDGEILGYSAAEQDLKKLGATDEQIAWRRWKIRNELSGDEAAFANQYPSTPEEAFLSGGTNVFNADQVRQAKGTVRPCAWRGAIYAEPGQPAAYRLVRDDSGYLLIWEEPKDDLHYAIGADTQWGTKDTADYDAAYVECLETRKVVARFKARLDTYLWASTLASLGHWYNRAVLAPEINGKGGQQVKLVLMGRAGNQWSYPNLYIRNRLRSFGIPKVEDYGWLTDEHSKADLVIHVKTSLEHIDFADADCVSEMAAYIKTDDLKFTAPEGQHDDLLMARMITSRVAQEARTRLGTPDEQEPFDPARAMRTPEQRMAEMIDPEGPAEAESGYE